MVLHLSGYVPVERAPPDSTTTGSLSSSNTNLSRDGPSNVGPSVVPTSLLPTPSTSPNPNLLSSSTSSQSSISTSNLNTSSTGSSFFLPSTSSTGFQSNTEATSSQSFPFSTEGLWSGTTSGSIVSQSNSYPSDAGNGYLQETIAPSLPVSIWPSTSFSLTSPSLSSPSSSTSSESTTISTIPSSSTPSSSPSTASSYSSSSSTSYPISTHKTLSSSSTTSGSLSSSTVPITLPVSTSFHSSFPATKTFTSTVSSTSIITTISSGIYSLPSSHTAPTSSFSRLTFTTFTVVPYPSTFFVSTDTPWTSTLTLTSVLPNSGTTTWTTTTTSGVLSTVGVDNTANRLSSSPGSIAGIALGILGAIAFGSLLLFCARRRRRQLIRDASAIPPWASSGPLEAEIDMEEPYAGILAALNAGMGAGRDAHIEGDTSGEVSGELAIPLASSPTNPLYSLPGEGYNDDLYVFPLSPPPAAYVAPPPSAYVPPDSSTGPRRRSSPGPDASAWLGGYNIAPAPSVTSHHSHSTTNVLTRTETGTRTRTGSEEPLLTRAGSGSSYLHSGNKIRLGSAFGSPKESMNGYNTAPTSPSFGRRSNTVSSFGALGSVSSRGAMRSTSSHGYEFALGSASSGGGSYRGPALGLAINGTPNSYTSKRAMKWKNGKRESTTSSMSATSASAYSSTDEKPAGVRAFLDRLRLRNTPRSKSNSSRDLESDGASEKRNTGAPGLRTSPRTFSAALSPATLPLEPMPVPTTPRFVLSNPDPDPQPHSPYVKVDLEGAPQGHEDGLRPPSWLWHGQGQANLLPPSPAFTFESRIAMADGLLDPRLRETVEGRSNASLLDFEDYSRPIGGLVNNRMHSTTTFGTVDSQDGASMRNREDDQGEDTCAAAAPSASWIVDDIENNFHAY